MAAQLVAVSGRGAPVSLLECLDQLDRRAALVFEDGLHAGMRGGLQLLEGRWVIILNQGDGRQRARFTLAHEIGHIALGECGAGRRRPLGWRIEEALCDVFAAELLMPAPWLRREWRGLRGEEAERVAALARRFDVSRAAARRRLRELGLSSVGGAASVRGAAAVRGAGAARRL